MDNLRTVTLTEFLLARIAEDEALLEDEDHVYGGGGEVWTKEAHARAVAECESKRRIIAAEQDHMAAQRIPDEVRARFVNPDGSPIMYALAAVYADHPDYREEWRR